MLDGTERPQPIFIIGAPRSGTSILTWCLGRHKNIKLMPETLWVATMAVAFTDAYAIGTMNRSTQLSLHEVSKECFLSHFADSVDELLHHCFEERWNDARENLRMQRRTKQGPFRLLTSGDDPKYRWVDGAPVNTRVVLGISALFPSARFIHLMRDPREVVASLRHFDRVGGRAYRFGEALRIWRLHFENALAAEILLGQHRVRRIVFDDLKSDPERVLKRCLAFIGEEFETNCTEPITQKINSSQVQETERESGLHILRPGLHRAVRLYRAARCPEWRPQLDRTRAHQRLEESEVCWRYSMARRHLTPQRALRAMWRLWR